MMEGENVKAFAPPSQLPLHRDSTPSPILQRGACAGDQKSFDEFIRNQFQALIYALVFVVFKGSSCFRYAQVWLPFYQEKGKSPSAAVSRGKPEPMAKNNDRFKVPACAGKTTTLLESVIDSLSKDKCFCLQLHILL